MVGMKGEKGDKTYVIVSIFDESISAGLSLHHACFVEEKVELGDLAEFGENLEECVSALHG